MRSNLFKLAQAATLAVAMSLTLSCSSDSDDPPSDTDNGINRNGSQKITEIYALKDVTDNSFTYTRVDTISGSDYCGVFGVLKRKAEIYDETANYTINNGILVWEDYQLKFNGTSNNLTGIWTRELEKSGYFYGAHNITKAEFTDNELKITYDYCAPDRMLLRYGEDRGNGWKIRNVNCETYEIYKGNDVITVKEESRLDVLYNVSITYKGKTCSGPTLAQSEKACSDAWKEFLQVENITDPTALAIEVLEGLLEIYLGEYLYKEQAEREFAECLVNTIPYSEVPRGDYKGFLWGF